LINTYPQKTTAATRFNIPKQFFLCVWMSKTTISTWKCSLNTWSSIAPGVKDEQQTYYKLYIPNGPKSTQVWDSAPTFAATTIPEVV